MEVVRNFGISICITIVATGIFSILIPNGTMEKVVKFTVSLFFLLSLIIPFVNGLKNFKINYISNDITTQSNKNLENNINQNIINITKSKLEQSIFDILKKNDILIKKVSVDINIIDKSSIDISKIEIYIDSQQKDYQIKIKELIKKEVEVTPQIILN